MAVAQSTRRRAIILLVLTSIILITLDLQNSTAISGLRNIFGAVFRPVESTTRVITRPISNAWYGIFNYNDVLDENDRLREKVAQQQGATVAAAASVRLAQELLALNGLPTLAGINAVTAQVIGESPTNFSQTIEINQGSESGIRVGMPVLNAAGLVGKVTKVYGDRSVVMLITDPDFALSIKVVNSPRQTATTTTIAKKNAAVPSPVVPVEPDATQDSEISTTTTTTTTTTIAGFTPSVTTLPATPAGVSSITVPLASDLAIRETGVIEGRGPSRQPTVRFISNAVRFGDIQVGVPIVTAGGSRSLAPPDILVGTVSRVVERLGSAGPVLEIEPVADLTNLSFLRVLLYQPITEKVTP
ncbi:MAG: rod shape-determining protein MreC [Actinomycetota bacterium]|nr:rod shape-determining protein MreC [Actinomycetota bacterium]